MIQVVLQNDYHKTELAFPCREVEIADALIALNSDNDLSKALLKKDMEFLDHIQIEMATARQFLFIARCKNMKQEQVFNMANRVEKVITEQGFEVRRMKKEDIKRFLAIYFDASMNGELMPDTDGEQFYNLP